MTQFFQFDTYSSAELDLSSEHLLSGLKTVVPELVALHAGDDRRIWTDIVLNWFANAAPKPPVVVDTSRPSSTHLAKLSAAVSLQFREPRTGYGETLRVDQLHWRGWPPYQRYWSRDYWRASIKSKQKLECVLALECEWAGNNDNDHYLQVMHEVGKLLSLSALTKVIVFASREPKLWSELNDDIRALRANANDRAPWLIVDIPHGDWGSGPRPQARVLSGS